MKAEIDAIIQARMDSSRLPGKIILPLQGKPILAHIIERIRRSERIRHIIVATTKDSLFAIQSVTAAYPEVKIFVGDKDDVLARYVGAAKKYQTEVIVRATGDNPLVSPKYIDKAVEWHLRNHAHLTHYIGIPLGTGVEVIQADVLDKISKLTRDPYDHEHVTPFFYKNKDLFHVAEPKAPPFHFNPNLRVTVDTPEDYRKLLLLFKDFGNSEKDIEISDIIRYFHQEFAESPLLASL